MTTQSFTDGVTLTAASWFNDVDTSAYSGLTTVAGTASVITAVGPASMTTYAARQRFILIPSATNTSMATINLTCNSVALGARNIFANGAACIGGELQNGVPAILIDDGTRLHIANPSITAKTLTNTLVGNVALSNTGLYFDGPSVAQGTAGTWLVSGTVVLNDTVSQAQMKAKLWDGTTVIASATGFMVGASSPMSMSLSGVLASPAGNLRISVNDPSSTSGLIAFNASGNSKDCTITAVRIA